MAIVKSQISVQSQVGSFATDGPLFLRADKVLIGVCPSKISELTTYLEDQGELVWIVSASDLPVLGLRATAIDEITVVLRAYLQRRKPQVASPQHTVIVLGHQMAEGRAIVRELMELFEVFAWKFTVRPYCINYGAKGSTSTVQGQNE